MESWRFRNLRGKNCRVNLRKTRSSRQNGGIERSGAVARRVFVPSRYFWPSFETSSYPLPVHGAIGVSDRARALFPWMSVMVCHGDALHSWCLDSLCTGRLNGWWMKRKSYTSAFIHGRTRANAKRRCRNRFSLLSKATETMLGSRSPFGCSATLIWYLPKWIWWQHGPCIVQRTSTSFPWFCSFLSFSFLCNLPVAEALRDFSKLCF